MYCIYIIVQTELVQAIFQLMFYSSHYTHQPDVLISARWCLNEDGSNNEIAICQRLSLPYVTTVQAGVGGGGAGSVGECQQKQQHAEAYIPQCSDGRQADKLQQSIHAPLYSPAAYTQHRVYTSILSAPAATSSTCVTYQRYTCIIRQQPAGVANATRHSAS